jgi:hypothetical protein
MTGIGWGGAQIEALGDINEPFLAPRTVQFLTLHRGGTIDKVAFGCKYSESCRTGNQERDDCARSREFPARRHFRWNE